MKPGNDPTALDHSPKVSTLDYASAQMRQPGAVSRLANSRGIWVITLILIAIALTWIWAFRGPEFYIFAFIGFAILILISTGRINGLPQRKQIRARCVWASRIILLATLAATIGTDVCPHARYLCVGPYFIAIRGRGCHNSRRARTIITLITGRYITSDSW